MLHAFLGGVTVSVSKLTLTFSPDRGCRNRHVHAFVLTGKSPSCLTLFCFAISVQRKQCCDFVACCALLFCIEARQRVWTRVKVTLSLAATATNTRVSNTKLRCDAGFAVPALMS